MYIVIFIYRPIVNFLLNKTRRKHVNVKNIFKVKELSLQPSVRFVYKLIPSSRDSIMALVRHVLIAELGERTSVSNGSGSKS